MTACWAIAAPAIAWLGRRFQVDRTNLSRHFFIHLGASLDIAFVQLLLFVAILVLYFYGGRTFAVDYGDVDFAALARVLGAFGERVKEPGEVLPAVRRALESGRPAVVDVVIDQNTHAPVVFKGG